MMKIINGHHSKQQDAWHATIPLDMRREDVDTAQAIDKAVEIQGRIGTSYAAAYLNSRGITDKMAVRVLSRPGERRKSE